MIPWTFRSILMQAISALTLISLATGQNTCNQGMGRVMYERLPNQQLHGFDDDVVRDTAPPFRVLEKCQDLCLRDRSAAGLVRTCGSVDFQPGVRIASFSGNSEYEESTCYLTREQAAPEGLGTLMLVPNSVHFNEICLSSNRPERECPSQRYVFERHARKRLKLPSADLKEFVAANRTDCEDKCLNEFSFVCRSATYDTALRTCSLSRFTRRTHPEMLEDDHNADYLENTCLSTDRRCDGLAVFIKEENKRLGGPFEAEVFSNLTLDECQAMCVRAEKYFCRSIEHDMNTKSCVLSEEDSVSQKDDLTSSASPTHHFYDLVCLDNPRGSEYPDNSVTSHLFSPGRRPDTAFQRFRNSRITGEFHSEITGRSLSECLDECLRQTSFQCRSAVYSDRVRTCRLSRYNQKDGMRLLYDPDYDYYENLMQGENATPGQGSGNTGESGWQKPPTSGTAGNDRDRYPDDDRYLMDDDRYPPRPDDGRPDDRYPTDRRPMDRYPADRFSPAVDRYPSGFDRYPSADRWAMMGGNRYPMDYPPVTNDIDRYPSRFPARYPMSRYPMDRYSPRGRYPMRPYDYPESGRYPSSLYPVGAGKGRYPGGGMTDAYDRYPQTGSSYFGKHYGYGRGYHHEYAGGDRYPDGPERYPDAGDRPPYGGIGADRPPYGGVGGGRRPYTGYRGQYGPAAPVYPRPQVIGGGIGAGGGYGPVPPYDDYGGNRPGGPAMGTRCEDEGFRQMGRQRMQRRFVRRYTSATSLAHCQRECMEARDFECRAFNFRDPGGDPALARDNCELSDRDTRELNAANPSHFDNTLASFDYYERASYGRSAEECLDVSQVCNEDGMEFTLHLPEGFYGRMYTYGFYDRCFFRGNGGHVNVLRISGAHGYPDCGTQRYGDSMTNIVVVQFSDNVQTSRDKRFNLTCLFHGPAEAVVTSNYIGAGSGSPIPIEYLPEESSLSSRVRLLILYQGRPTTTIAVGDPLTFKLESQDPYAGDLFATNVVARDPYSGRSVQLIDRAGCPVDSFVFPELDKGRNSDSLEARFNAFKIPESNFLVFEATVRTCREGCQPAYCPSNTGRSEPSFGRKKREINSTENLPENSTDTEDVIHNNTFKTSSLGYEVVHSEESDSEDKPRHVRRMIEVFDSRSELPVTQPPAGSRISGSCISPQQHRAVMAAMLVLMAILFALLVAALFFYRRYWRAFRKTLALDKTAPSPPPLVSAAPMTANSRGTRTPLFGSALVPKPFSVSGLGRSFVPDHRTDSTSALQASVYDDGSEPIYTDPSLFDMERSRSLRSLDVGRHKN